MTNIRVTRTIQYEGEEDWVNDTVARSLVQFHYPFTCPKGCIALVQEGRGPVEQAAEPIEQLKRGEE